VVQAGVIEIIFFDGGLSVKCFKRCQLKQTEVNCHPRYSCSKLLLIDVVFIWFSDRMLFTLTTLKFGVWHLVQRRIEYWSKTRLFHTRMTPMRSVANGDRRRVEIELRQCDICRSWSSNRWNLT